MLYNKKAVTIKVKTSSNKKAKSQIRKLQKNLGYVNKNGLKVGKDSVYHKVNIASYYMVDHYDIENFLSKSGSYYTVKITKRAAQDYIYSCRAFKRVWNRAVDGYYLSDDDYKNINRIKPVFSKDVHLCDLSDIAKAMVSSLVITDAHAYDISLKCKPTFKSMWKSFNSDKCKDDFVCGEFAKARAMMGNALGFEVKCYSGGGHIWAVYRGKDRGGKIRKCRADNDILAYSTTSFFDSRIFYYFLLG